VESPGKLVREKVLEARLTKIFLLRNIDSVVPGNDAKMLSHSL
jgi:hypothetical protein